MPQPSAPTTVAFVTLVLAVATAFVVATYRAGVRVGEPRPRTLAWTAGATLLVGGSLAVSATLARAGILRDFSATPPAAARLIVVTTGLTLVAALSPLGGRMARGLTLQSLLGFQAFRVLVEALLFALHRAGALPVQMTFEGANFDVVTGLTALPIAWWAVRGAPRWALVAWNALGLALLATVMAIAALSLPTALRRFAVPLTLVADAPYVWLPTLLVQAALFAHVVALRALGSAAQRRSAGRLDAG